MTNLHIRPLQSGEEAFLESFLLPRLETSMFLLGNMRASGLSYNGERYTGTYVAAFEQNTTTDCEEIVGVVAHYWNQALILQAPAHLDMLWRKALAVSGRPLGGLIGSHTQVSAVKAALSVDKTNLQLDQVEKLYSLDLDALIVPEALRSGQVRARRPIAQDLDTLTHWYRDYALEALGNEASPALKKKARADAEYSLQGQDTWILETQGHPIAMTSFNTRIKEAVQVGGVWTPPDLRSRGYARCAVAASLLEAHAEGVKKAILFTGKDNVPAQKAYTALGFQHIGDYYLLMFSKPLKDAHNG